MDSIKVRTIKYIVNNYLKIDVDKNSRKYEFIKARLLCYKIIREECNFTVQNIGRFFDKNHATVLHALKEFKGIEFSDKKFKEDYKGILKLWHKPERERTKGLDIVIQLDLQDEIKKLKEESIYLYNAINAITDRIEQISKEKKIKKDLEVNNN